MTATALRLLRPGERIGTHPADSPAGPAAKQAPALHDLQGGGPLPAGRFVALVPGAEVTLLRLDLPSGLAGAARAAVAGRQALDRLGATAGDGLDIRPAPLGGDRPGGHAFDTVLVAARDRIAAWRAAVAPAGRRCLAILPDYLALPAAPGLWTVATPAAGNFGGGVRVRLGPGDGFSAEPDLAGAALEAALARGPAPAAVLRLGPAAPGFDAAFEALLAAHPGIACATTPGALPAGLTPPRMLAHGEMGLDLGSDAHDLRQAIAAGLRRLVLPLVLAGAGLAGWLAATGIETRRIAAETAALETAVETGVRQHFLPSDPLVDIRAQVTRVLDDRRARAAAAETGFDTGDTGDPAVAALALLHAAATVLAAEEDAMEGAAGRLPETRMPETRLTEIRLADPGPARAGAGGGTTATDDAGALEFDLEAADFAALDRVVAQMRAAGLETGILRSGAGEDRIVRATLRVTGWRAGQDAAAPNGREEQAPTAATGGAPPPGKARPDPGAASPPLTTPGNRPETDAGAGAAGRP